MVNTFAVVEQLSERDGIYIMEHPEDPGEEPYCSVWATEEWRELALRTGASVALLDQCCFGGSAKKLSSSRARPKCSATLPKDAAEDIATPAHTAARLAEGSAVGASSRTPLGCVNG